MNKGQKGFSVVEVVMGVVIVGLLGALGWMYWTNVANKPKDETKSSETNSTVVKSSPTPVAKKTYNSKTLGLAFDYPESWSLNENTTKNKSFGDERGLQDTDTTKLIRDKITVSSKNNLTLFFETIPYRQLGGMGSTRNISNFQYYGDTKLQRGHIVGYTSDGKYYLHLASYKTEDAAKTDIGFGVIIQLKEDSAINSKNIDEAYAVEFGTIALGLDPISTATPNENDLNEAIDILKSLRKA